MCDSVCLLYLLTYLGSRALCQVCHMGYGPRPVKDVLYATTRVTHTRGAPATRKQGSRVRRTPARFHFVC